MRRIRLGQVWYGHRAALVAALAVLVVLLIVTTGLVAHTRSTGSDTASPGRSPAGPGSPDPGTPSATSPTPAPTGSREPPGTPTPTGVPAFTTPGRPGPGRVPDRAFFELPSRNRHGVKPRFQDGPILPPLCGKRLPDGSVEDRRLRHLVYVLRPQPANVVPDGSMDQSVTSFRPGTARSWLARLRTAVATCPEQTIDGIRYRHRLMTDSGYGDESVLVELTTTERESTGGPTRNEVGHLLRAVRIGDVVTILWDHGWEGTSTDRGLLDDFSVRAVRALRDWLDG